MDLFISISIASCMLQANIDKTSLNERNKNTIMDILQDRGTVCHSFTNQQAVYTG